MPRIMLVVFLGASLGLLGQTPDTRADASDREIALLKRTVADQERRLATLERTVRSLQNTSLAATRTVRPSWRNAEGWAAVRLGMSRDQVVEILGEPKSTDIVIDRQTLWYKDAADPVGNVIIVGDRVAEVSSARFQIFLTPPK